MTRKRDFTKPNPPSLYKASFLRLCSSKRLAKNKLPAPTIRAIVSLSCARESEWKSKRERASVQARESNQERHIAWKRKRTARKREKRSRLFSRNCSRSFFHCKEQMNRAAVSGAQRALVEDSSHRYVYIYEYINIHQGTCWE